MLHGIDLTVGDGEIVVVLGANGAGKTTTMRAISGVDRPAGHGRASTGATSPNELARRDRAAPASPRCRRAAGRSSTSRVEDNLRVGALHAARTARSPPTSTAGSRCSPASRERRTQKAGSLSGGEQQMLAIARALMSRPRLLLCDEPSLGLAPIIVQELFAILSRLNTEEGVSVLLVEQNANLAMDIAHRAYLLETGTHRRVGRRRRRSATTTPSARRTSATRRRRMEQFLQYFFDGLSQGAIYALLALGLVIVYRGTGHLNFAQGEMAMISAFLAWWYDDLGLSPWLGRARRRRHRRSSLGHGDRAVDHPAHRPPQPVRRRRRRHRPVPRAQRLAAVRLEGHDPRGRSRRCSRTTPDDFVRIGGAEWRIQDIGDPRRDARHRRRPRTLLFQKTKFGLAMRAVASNPESAPLVGIKTGQVLAVSWGLAAARRRHRRGDGGVAQRQRRRVDDVRDLLLGHGRGDARRLRQPASAPWSPGSLLGVFETWPPATSPTSSARSSRASSACW